jgi:hypothetical protein
MAISNAVTLGARTVNETRAQFTHSDLRALPSDQVGLAVSIAGVASFGTLSSSPQGRLNRMIEVVDNVSHQSGAHALRAGIDVLHNDDRIAFPRATRGSYAFSSLANFLRGTYNNAGFTQTFGATEVSQASTNVGLFAQDEWSASSSLTLNLGLRYEFLSDAKEDNGNFANLRNLTDPVTTIGITVQGFEMQLYRKDTSVIWVSVNSRAVREASGALRYYEGTAEDIMIHAKEFKRIKQKMNEILLKHTGHPLDKIEKDTDRDRFMSADEAMEYKLIDRVIEHVDLKNDK